MDVERMTLRVQNALNEANLIAVKNSNQQMDVIHPFFKFSWTTRWINTKYIYKNGSASKSTWKYNK